MLCVCSLSSIYMQDTCDGNSCSVMCAESLCVCMYDVIFKSGPSPSVSSHCPCPSFPQGQRPYFPPMQYPRPNQWPQAPGLSGTTRPYGQSSYGRGGRGGGRMGGISRVAQQPSGTPARNVPTQPRPTPPAMPGAPPARNVKYTAVARNHPAPQGGPLLHPTHAPVVCASPT